MNLEEKVLLLWTFNEFLTDLFWVPDSNVQENPKFFNKIKRKLKKGFGVMFKHPDKLPDILKS